MRQRIVMLGFAVLVVAACSGQQDVPAAGESANTKAPTTSSSGASSSSSPTGLSTTPIPTQNGASAADPGVLGEVATPEAAFCAGLASTLADTWGPDTQSDVFIRPMTYGECVEEGLADGMEVSDDLPLDSAFVFGCTLALVTTLDSALSLGEEADVEVAQAVCGQPFWDVDMMMFDYRITTDGLCYMGLGPDAGLPGCQDASGAYVTTTTFAYTASGRLDEYLAHAATGPTSLALATDPNVATDVAQEWCSFAVDYGTGEWAAWLVDIASESAGRHGYTNTEYASTAEFLPLLAETAIEMLCPEVADDFQQDLESARAGDSMWSPMPDLRGMGSALMAWETTHMRTYADIFREAGAEYWVRVGNDICKELDEGIDPEDRFLSIEAWMDAGAPHILEDLEPAADAVHDSAIAGICPRHSKYYWSVAETGSPWWDAGA